MSNWTVDTLREHVERLDAERDKRLDERWAAQQAALQTALLAAEKAVNAALAASDRAVSKSETAAERRFEAVNEFRAALADQAAMFVTRVEADARFASVGESLSRQSDATGAIELKVGALEMDAVRKDGLKPLHEAIDKLREANSASAGRSLATAYILSVALAVAALGLSVFVAVTNSSGNASRITEVERREAPPPAAQRP